MGKRIHVNRRLRQSIDDLFSEFVHEMNRFSTNGVVRDVDHDRVIEMAGHFLSQCPTRGDRNELEERMLLLLSSKYNYRLLEGELRLSERLEESVRAAIVRVCGKYFKDASRFAGIAVNWSFVKPYKIFKSFLEPAIANTVLTYSIAVHAPQLDRADLESRLIAAVSGPATEVSAPRNHDSGMYAELEQVRQYSGNDLDGLMETIHTADTKLSRSSLSASNFSESQKLQHDSGLTRKLVSVNLEPSSTNASLKEKKHADLIRIEKNLVSEIRPIGIVQDVISRHELNIFNCYKLTQNKLQQTHGRVSVRFAITTQGATKDVSVLHNSFNKELAMRISNQIKYFRFSSIDSKLGDQTVYHTFYF